MQTSEFIKSANMLKSAAENIPTGDRKTEGTLLGTLAGLFTGLPTTGVLADKNNKDAWKHSARAYGGVQRTHKLNRRLDAKISKTAPYSPAEDKLVRMMVKNKQRAAIFEKPFKGIPRALQIAPALALPILGALTGRQIGSNIEKPRSTES